MASTTATVETTEKAQTTEKPEVKFELNASEEELLEEFGVLMVVEYGYMA